MFLCQRCDSSSDFKSPHNLCYDCYTKIMSKYTIDGKVVPFEHMNNIEEAEQYMEMYLKKQNGGNNYEL